MFLTPAQFCIVKFGGVRALARKLNVDQAAVHRWKNKPEGIIPTKHAPLILKLSKDLNLNITPENLLIGGIINTNHVAAKFPWLVKHD